MTLNIAIKGGLGNQLFQYAFATYLQRKFNCVVNLDVEPLSEQLENLTPRPYLLNKLFLIKDLTDAYTHDLFFTQNDPFFRKIFKKLIRSIKNYVYVGEHLQALPVLKSDTTYYLDGYWQNREYAMAVLPELDQIANQFTSSSKLAPQLSGSGSAAIHIRRGDYVSNAFINSYHGVCDIHYFHRAVAYLEKEKQITNYFVFSDDISWAKENIKLSKPVQFVEGDVSEPFTDLFLMRLCPNMILSNSSFSCWAAYLNTHKDRTVIAPENWTRKDKTKDLPLFDVSWKVM